MKKKKLADKERSEALRSIETLEGCLFFTGNMDEKNFQFCAQQKLRLNDLSRGALKPVVQHVNKKLAELVSMFKISAAGKTELRKSYHYLENKEIAERVLNVPKPYLAKYISGLDEKPEFVDCPSHGLIEIPFRFSDVPPTYFGFKVPEIMFYESMAAMMNRLIELPTSDPKHDKSVYKERDALKRATLVFAFSFVEAYLNGLAARVVFGDVELSAREKVSDKDLAQVLERNPKDFDRSSFVSFRHKALQYPRIVIGADFPPFTESNCAELKVLLETSKIYRDAIAHPSFGADVVAVNAGKLDLRRSSKLESLIMLSDDEVSKTVDSAVGFVQKVEALAGGRIGQYVLSRNPDGRFPDLAFA